MEFIKNCQNIAVLNSKLSHCLPPLRSLCSGVLELVLCGHFHDKILTLSNSGNTLLGRASIPALSSVLISRDCGCDVAALNISQPKLPAFETQSHPDTWPQLQPPVLALAVSSGAACVTSSSTRRFSLHKSAPRQDILIKYSLNIYTKIRYIYIKLG